MTKRYYLDTEFIDDGKSLELISLCLVADDDRELYLCNKDFDYSRADNWVRTNVIRNLPYREARDGWATRHEIAAQVMTFVRPVDAGYPEIWGFYADYDWVVLCQLFGKMLDLPDHFPKLCLDLKQEAMRLGNPPLPEQTHGQHMALWDARWMRQAHEYLMRLEGAKQ